MSVVMNCAVDFKVIYFQYELKYFNFCYCPFFQFKTRYLLFGEILVDIDKFAEYENLIALYPIDSIH